MARVLIIEDSPAQAAFIQELVTAAGHEPIWCAHPERGVVPLVKSVAPQIVLLDLVLLGADGKQTIDGFQICREIKRSASASVAVVIVSSRTDAAAAEWAELQGADAYLPKPFQLPELTAILERVLPTSR